MAYSRDFTGSPLKRRILIVDDDPSLRNGMARLVSMQGHEPITAATVKESLALLESGPTHILLDMNLPDGVGTTVLRHVRTSKLPVKVAVLSGSMDSSLIKEAEALNPDALFVKPPDWDAVLDWIATA